MAGQKKTAKAQATPAPVSAPEAVEETKDPIEIRQLEAEVALETLASLRVQIKDLESFLKSYVKDTTKMLRQYEKKAADAEAKAASGGRRVRRAPNPNKKPSGFAKKTKITPDFVKFMTDADVKKVIGWGFWTTNLPRVHDLSCSQRQTVVGLRPGAKGERPSQESVSILFT